MKQTFTLLAMFFLFSCARDKKIVSDEVITQMMRDAVQRSETTTTSDSDMKFWQAKLSGDTGSYVNMVQLGFGHLGRFKSAGSIEDLEQADKLLRKASEKLNHTNPEILHALSQLSITRHRFREAYEYNKKAKQANASPYLVALLDFDASLELGNFHEAEKNLSSMLGRNSFDFLIRKSRFQDMKGNLDEAIRLMESALDKAEKSNKRYLQCWTRTHLGDMYGHAGRIEDAFASYQEALQLDPSFSYAWKGIAWIAYAHDGNVELARTITEFIASKDHNPEHELFLAELAEYQHRPGLQQHHLRKFAEQVSVAAYGDMYNKYLVEIYSDNKLTLEKALALALRETKNRPTPETYSWLSMVYCKMGATKKALEIYRAFVEGRTYEPEALAIGILIYRAEGNKEKVSVLLENCRETAFELGPVKMRELESLK